MAVELEFESRPKILQHTSDSLIMIKRSSTHIIRNIDQLLGTFLTPIMFLLLFATVFGGAISQSLPPGIDYLDFLLAGIIVQTVAFGSTTTAIAITNDLQRGIIDRFRSLPMSNLAVLNGHVISDLFRNGISTIVMIAVGLLMGFRSSASFIEWLMIIGIILLFTFAFSWLSAIVGVLAKSVEAVQWLTFVIVFPLTFASNAFVPVSSFPSWMQGFAEYQPISQIVEAIRALMLGTPVDSAGWLAVMWCIVITATSIPLTLYLFNRRSLQ